MVLGVELRMTGQDKWRGRESLHIPFMREGVELQSMVVIKASMKGPSAKVEPADERWNQTTDLYEC